MKSKQVRILVMMSILAYLQVATAAAERIPLDTQERKVSYAIGQQMGKSMKAQGVKIDSAVIKMSLDDAFSGREPAISPAEAQQAMQQLQGQLMKKQQELAKVNVEKAKKFLDENKQKKGITATASGLQYQVLKEGTGPNPKPTDKVKVHYRGTLIDGTEFDSSYKRNAPAEFPLNGVIKGWTEGIPLMKVGGKTKFFVPSELAYGPAGRPSIPPNSVLIFEVELLEIM